MSAAVILFVVALVALNSAVTVFLARADFLLPNQKLAQGLLVWLVPVLGAIGIGVFLISNRERPQPRSHHIPQEEGEWLGGSGRSSLDGD